MKVKCYRNLNRKGVVWSVLNIKTGLVIDRSPTVYLSSCTFKVSQKGNKRVRQNKRKNVHAFVKGKRIKGVPKAKWKRVSYNPYTMKAFTDQNGNSVYESKYVKLNKKGCWINDNM